MLITFTICQCWRVFADTRRLAITPALFQSFVERWKYLARWLFLACGAMVGERWPAQTAGQYWRESENIRKSAKLPQVFPDPLSGIAVRKNQGGLAIPVVRRGRL